LESHLLPQHHLIESTDEEGIQEATVEDRQADNTTDELEVIEMLGVDTRVRINLKGIIIVGGVFEKAVEGVEHFVREKEKEFTKNISQAQRKESFRDEEGAYRERPP
jgi:hypothetical protein